MKAFKRLCIILSIAGYVAGSLTVRAFSLPTETTSVLADFVKPFKDTMFAFNRSFQKQKVTTVRVADTLSSGSGFGGGSNLVLYWKYIVGVSGQSPPSCPTGWQQAYSGYGPHYIAVFGTDWLAGGSGGAGGGFGRPAGEVPPDTREPFGYNPPERYFVSTQDDEVDADQLNLLANAIAFTQDGRPPPFPVVSGPPPVVGPVPFPVPFPPPPGGGGEEGGSYTTQRHNTFAIASDSICSVSESEVVPSFQFYLNASSGIGVAYSHACDVNGTECNLCIVCEK